MVPGAAVAAPESRNEGELLSVNTDPQRTSVLSLPRLTYSSRFSRCPSPCTNKKGLEGERVLQR